MDIVNDGKHGQRLGELLDMGFRSQVEAATALDVVQASISYWKKQPVLRRTFFLRYADILRSCGLNPDYILNPDEPMLLGLDRPKSQVEMSWRIVRLENELNELRKQVEQ